MLHINDRPEHIHPELFDDPWKAESWWKFTEILQSKYRTDSGGHAYQTIFFPAWGSDKWVVGKDPTGILVPGTIVKSDYSAVRYVIIGSTGPYHHCNCHGYTRAEGKCVGVAGIERSPFKDQHRSDFVSWSFTMVDEDSRQIGKPLHKLKPEAWWHNMVRRPDGTLGHWNGKDTLTILGSIAIHEQLTLL